MSGSGSSGLGSFSSGSSCDFDVEVNLASPDRNVTNTLRRDDRTRRRNLPINELIRIIGIVAPEFQRGISFHLGI